ncbi:serine threonine kinase [Fusarium agapanthi]|uniref:Serine threonine kinase n=1 Tax=Fusarium agapanthi TaxID=1803897 RepID=A0A9P5BIZ2_9HYPO|nr:serine threonine kinase [Fusarium agapanthi]
MTPSVETTAYIVPLMDFERSLVMEVQAYVDKETINQNSDFRSFEVWKWSQLLQQVLRHYLDTQEDVLRVEAGGSRSRAYEACFFGLGNDDHLAKHRARMMQIRNANPTFVDDLAEKSSLSIRAVPDPNDQGYWRTLNSLVDAFGRPWDTPDELDLHCGKFDIFSLIRIYFLHSLSPLSATMISDSVTNHDVFLEHYTVSSNHKPGRGDELQAQNAFTHRTIHKTKKPANILSDEELIGAMLSLASTNKQYPDPRTYLSYIPWEDLNHTSKTSLEDVLLGPDRYPIDEQVIVGWVTWKSPRDGFACNHHLNVEDEIFAYTLRTGWNLPGHSIGGKTVFSMTRLEHSKLISELDRYWSTWNDCAITRSPTGEVFVLETVPGLRFRGRAAGFDHATAIAHLRNMIESHASETLDRTYVKELLGLEPGYKPLFENSLKVIHAEQLSSVEWKRPIGSGRNGRVYTSTWKYPGGVLSTSTPSRTEVVLKEITPNDFGVSCSLQKFMKELDSTYAALGSQPMCCVKFFGITQMSLLRDENPRLLFVFERATRGHVEPFLLWHLSPLRFYGSWRALADCFVSIATGLAFIHEHGVVHRMMGGETAFANYGAIDFRAPEQILGLPNVHAFAAEVFTFGVVACKLLNCRSLVSSVEIPSHIRDSASEDIAELSHTTTGKEELQDGHIVPRAIRRIISRCLSHRGFDRPDMSHVLDELEDITSTFTEDNMERQEGRTVDWCYWDWEATFRAALSDGDSDSNSASSQSSRFSN